MIASRRYSFETPPSVECEGCGEELRENDVVTIAITPENEKRLFHTPDCLPDPEDV